MLGTLVIAFIIAPGVLGLALLRNGLTELHDLGFRMPRFTPRPAYAVAVVATVLALPTALLVHHTGETAATAVQAATSLLGRLV